MISNTEATSWVRNLFLDEISIRSSLIPTNSKIIEVVKIDRISDISLLFPIKTATNALVMINPMKIASPPSVGIDELCELRPLGFLVRFFT